MRAFTRTISTFAVATLALASGCAGLGRYPSLGTYHVDGERLVVIDIGRPDTLATLGFGDTVEVIDAPMDERASDELFVVRSKGRYGRVERDHVMSDHLFRSKYTAGHPVLGSAGVRYYLDEFRDTVRIHWQENVVRTVKAVDGDDVVVTEKPKARKKRPR